MSLNLFTFLFFYFLIINSTLGYGFLISKLTKLNLKYFNISFLGLLGIFVLIIISYLTHFFTSHDYVHNSLILSIGLVFFFLFFKKQNKNKDILKLNFFFLIFYIGLIIFKSHDDFSYYHFPYIYYLTQSELFLGVGNFNHGFRTPSSIFYLNSLFYLPIIKYYFFQIGAALIMVFTTFNFFDLINKRLKENNFDKLFFLSLLFFMFILIFFYRIAEHGTDRSAQILIFLLISELLIIINYEKGIKENIAKISILLGIIVSLKSFYVLYIALTIPVFYYFYKKNKFEFIFLIFKNYFFYLSLILILSILIVNFFNSGCLVYPVSFTCFEKFSWSIPIAEVLIMNDWYEQWSKAGANPNFRVENPQEYIQYFNWVGNWFEEYFFTKVSDFILGILFLVLIFLFVFKSKKKTSPTIYKGEKFIYLIILILFFEWFYNHPSLRYGGYQLVCLLLFLPVSNILSNRYHNTNNLFKTNVLLLIAITIFLGRNIDRILNENQKYNFNPLVDPVYRVNNNYFSINEKMQKIINNKFFCDPSIKICKNDSGIDVKEKYGYKIFFKY